CGQQRFRPDACRRRPRPAVGGDLRLHLPGLYPAADGQGRGTIDTRGLRPLFSAGVPPRPSQMHDRGGAGGGGGGGAQVAAPAARDLAMTFAFLIYRYFPFGGQQRNMLAMAQEAHRRGHRVTVLCHHWQGDRPAGIEVVEVPVSGWTNHSRTQAFARAAAQILARRQVDLRVGFIKLPELDVYYAADPCFAEKALCQRGWLYRLAPRTRAYLALERAVFEPASG